MKKTIIIFFLSCFTALTIHAQAVRRSGVRDDIATKGKGSKPTPSKPTRPKRDSSNSAPSRPIIPKPEKSDIPPIPVFSHPGFHFENESPSGSSSQLPNGFRFEPTSTEQKGVHHGSESVRTDSLGKGQKSPSNEKPLSTDSVSANQESKMARQ